MGKYKYGTESMKKLNTCDPSIIEVFKYALALGITDISILYGYRSPEEQLELYKKGRMENHPGNWTVKNKSEIVTYKDGTIKKSEHNFYPSRAIDVLPFVDGKICMGNTSEEINKIIFMAGIICASFKALGIGYIWGGNWDSDGEIITDQNFNDLLHFQII